MSLVASESLLALFRSGVVCGLLEAPFFAAKPNAGEPKQQQTLPAAASRKRKAAYCSEDEGDEDDCEVHTTSTRGVPDQSPASSQQRVSSLPVTEAHAATDAGTSSEQAEAPQATRSQHIPSEQAKAPNPQVTRSQPIPSEQAEAPNPQATRSQPIPAAVGGSASTSEASSRAAPCRWDAAQQRMIFRQDVCGAIFGASRTTFTECIQRQLFGLPASRSSMVREIAQRPHDRTILFLFNFHTRQLHGIFAPNGPAGFPLHKRAWVPGVWSTALRCETNQGAQTGGKMALAERTPFVAQLPVRRVGEPFAPLDEAQYRPIMRYVDGHKFDLQLNASQVEELVTLLVKGQQCAGSTADAEAGPGSLRDSQGHASSGAGLPRGKRTRGR